MIDRYPSPDAKSRLAGNHSPGIVQAALGSIVVLVISTLNRVMVVEYARPALLPGALVALHYAVQLSRPRFGYGSDRSGRRTPWILGGMAVLVTGGVLCALATVGLSSRPWPALLLAIVAYILVGLGVGAAGTSLLVLLAGRVKEGSRAAAATTMWVLMIAGFALTSAVVGHFLDPFSPRRLIGVTSGVAVAAFSIALIAMWKVEGSSNADVLQGAPRGRPRGSESQRLRRRASPASGGSLDRGVSRISYSYPCWPTARRSFSSSPSRDWFLVTRSGSRPDYQDSGTHRCSWA